MEIRQLRYYISVVEHGSMGKAAMELGVVVSALSHQISRLEEELSTRLLQRTSTGVIPTDAGVAFWRQVQLALRHIDAAAVAARQARLSGHVSVGMPPSTASIMSLPFILAMRHRYPDVRLRMVESLSGHLSAMLKGRQIDLAVLFRDESGQRWHADRILNERLFAIGPSGMPELPNSECVAIAELNTLPLILPSESHGLRVLVDACFRAAGREPSVVAEIDGLAILMEAVGSGLGATIQPGAALARTDGAAFRAVLLSDANAARSSFVMSLSDDELSPAGLVARVVLTDVMRELVEAQRWPGASLA